MVRKYLVIFILVFSLQNAFSQVGGQKTYAFLSLAPPVPRTVALGGNTIGIKDDDFGLSIQNPAALSKYTNNAGFIGIAKYLGGIKHQGFAFGKSFEKVGHFAVGIQSINYATIDQRDEYGNELGTVKAQDYLFNIAYARDKDSMWTYGVNLKTIYSQYGQYKSVGNAVDVGVTYSNQRKQATVSAMLKNMGMQWKSYTGSKKEKLPYNVQVGASYKVPKAPFRLLAAYDYLNVWDLTYTDPNNPPPTEDPFTHEKIKKRPGKIYADKLGRHLIPGVEILLTKNFNLRVGFNYKRRAEMVLTDKQGLAGFSFGVGVRLTCLHFSWAYAQYTPGFGTNYFSVSMKQSDVTDFKKRIKERREAKAKEAS